MQKGRETNRPTLTQAGGNILGRMPLNSVRVLQDLPRLAAGDGDDVVQQFLVLAQLVPKGGIRAAQEGPVGGRYPEGEHAVGHGC